MIYVICDLNDKTVNIPFVDKETSLPEGAVPKYVGIIKDGHSLAVSLHQKRVQLMDDDFDADTIENDDCYTGRNESAAIHDWNGKTRTRRLLQQSIELRVYLKEGEYVPSLPELAFICTNRDELNAALEFVGGEQFTASGYWSSSESSLVCSWCVNFSSGRFYDGYKYSSYYVRPIIALMLYPIRDNLCLIHENLCLTIHHSAISR